MAIFVLLFLVLFITSHRGIFDLDIWLHLKAGEWILEHKTVPTQDIFSFTLSGRTWIDHSWLFQVTSYLIYKYFNLEGLIFLEALVVCFAFLFLALSFYKARQQDNPLAVLIIFFSIFACQTRYNIRPEIFSLLFFSIYLFLLKRPLVKSSFYILLFIQMLWVNLHGYFFIGPLLVFIFILQGFLARRFGSRLPYRWEEVNKIEPKEYLRLKWLFYLLLLANLINPQFLKGALYPLWVLEETLLGRNKLYFLHIQELQTIFEGKFAGSFHYLSLLILSLVSLVCNYQRLKLADVLLWAVALPFSFIKRNLAYFVLVAAQTIYFNFSGIKKLLPEKKTAFSWQRRALLRLGWVIFGLGLFYILRSDLFSTYFSFKEQKFKSYLSGDWDYVYPAKAVDFVLKERLPPRMLNDFNSGAYLIGRSYPKRQVFIDGRAEVYGQEFYQQWDKVSKADEEAFNKLIQKYSITAIFLSYAQGSSPKDLLKYLVRQPSWRFIYLDEAAVIFLKDIAENKELIERLSLDFKRWEVEELDLTKIVKFVYPSPYVKRAQVLDILQEDEAMLKELEQALRIMPHCAEALRLKGRVFLRKGLWPEAFWHLRAALIYLKGNIEIISDMAIVYQKMGKLDKAIDCYKYILKKDPQNIKAYKELLLLYKEKKDLKQTEVLLKKARKLFGDTLISSTFSPE